MYAWNHVYFKHESRVIRHASPASVLRFCQVIPEAHVPGVEDDCHAMPTSGLKRLWNRHLTTLLSVYDAF